MSQENPIPRQTESWRIQGQAPRLTWRLNPPGQSRTIEEAVRIARDHGVEIPEDVEFFVDEENYCDETTFAIGMRVSPRPPDEPVQWSELVHDLTGKVPFLIRPDVLNSDEAIVAVLAHEMLCITHKSQPLGGFGLAWAASVGWVSRACEAQPTA